MAAARGNEGATKAEIERLPHVRARAVRRSATLGPLTKRRIIGATARADAPGALDRAAAPAAAGTTRKTVARASRTPAFPRRVGCGWRNEAPFARRRYRP